MKLAAESLREFSDDALTVRLAGMRDAGDVEAVRLIAAEQQRRRDRAEQRRKAEGIPSFYIAVEDVPIRVHGRPLPDRERRELAAWVRLLAPEGVRRAEEADDQTERRITHD